MPYQMNPGQEYSPEKMGKVLEAVDEILMHHLMLNDKAMKFCHAIGYNGFKRLHRWNTKNFLCWHIKLENMAYDKHRMTLETRVSDFDYRPGDIIGHLQKWDVRLCEDIKMLGMLNNEYRDMSGKDNHIIDAALCVMAKDYEKAGRWHRRFIETKSAHDMHDLDDAIHAKYKAMEEADEILTKY